jgi:hypothetical protein
LVDALDAFEALVDFECRFLRDSGTPSHFEFTLGIFSGNFFCAYELGGRLVGEEVPFTAACLRCASAYCSNAACDGSLSDKNPSTPVFFFFLDDLLESSEEALLDTVEARLGDVRLAESNDGR